MPYLSDTDAKFVNALGDELSRLRIGGPPIQETLLPVLREALGLTPRQAEVLELVAQGLSNRTIADTFRVSQRVVEIHVSAIFDKAGVESRAALLSMLLFDKE
jgi:DNA-binding NarL/FixJ family response regulator